MCSNGKMRVHGWKIMHSDISATLSHCCVTCLRTCVKYVLPLALWSRQNFQFWPWGVTKLWIIKVQPGVQALCGHKKFSTSTECTQKLLSITVIYVWKRQTKNVFPCVHLIVVDIRKVQRITSHEACIECYLCRTCWHPHSRTGMQLHVWQDISCIII